MLFLLLLQVKDKEQTKKDEKRSAEQAMSDAKAAAEKGVKPTAAVVGSGDKGASAAGKPATAVDAAAELPKQEAANGTMDMSTDAPDDKVSAAVLVVIGIQGRVSPDAFVQQGCHRPTCRVHMMSCSARSLSSQSEAAPLS
jgi:hypothetical protein